MLKFLKQILHIDHLVITLLDFLFIAVILMVAVNISFFNPIERAIENFSMTDVCYQVENRTQVPDTSRIITIVDISEVKDRVETNIPFALASATLFELELKGFVKVLGGARYRLLTR